MSAVAKAQTFWRSAMEGIRHQPFVHAVSTITLAIALFTLGLARSAAHELDRLVGSLGGEVRVTVYLDPRASPEARTAVADGLRRRGMAVEEVSPRAALERLVRELGPAAESLRGLSEDPAAPVARGAGAGIGCARPSRCVRSPPSCARPPAVTGVDYGEQAVERLSAIARAVRWAGWVAFVVLVGATLIIVSATLQLAIYARREEVEIQKLVGRDRPLRPGAVPPRGSAPGARRCGAGHRRAGRLPPDALARSSPRSSPSSGCPELARRRAPVDGGARAGRWPGAALGLSGSYLAVHRFLRA